MFIKMLILYALVLASYHITFKEGVRGHRCYPRRGHAPDFELAECSVPSINVLTRDMRSRRRFLLVASEGFYGNRIIH